MIKHKPLLSRFGKRLRIRIITPYLEGHVLEIGCGMSDIPSLLDQNQSYVGIDKNPLIIHRLRDEYPNHGFICSNVELNELSLNEKFDTVLMLSLIEHLENPGIVFRNIADYLTASGNIIVTTPSYFGGIVHKVGAYMGLFSKQAAKDHKTFFSPKTLTKLLEKYNFILREHHMFLLHFNQLFVIQNNPKYHV